MLVTLVALSLATVVSSASLQQAADGTVTVQIEDGLLRGNIATSIWNKTYTSFQNVPYAQPPVGDLRFKSPRPVIPWTGVRDATKESPYCTQVQLSYTTANMSEDCLYLNVYIPQVEASAVPSAGLPVMVFIPGGAFTSGAGIRDIYGPDNLMNLTAILVTLNYRLGVLGFLAMEHSEMTSNAGMKDQVAALRWVNRNIAHFGGNPDQVTLFGQSAGGVSVELQLLSPMTQGLFQRAITESGSMLLTGGTRDYDGTQKVFLLGEVLGFNGTDADELVTFLRAATAEEVYQAGESLSSTLGEGIPTAMKTNIVIDAKIQDGSEVFLPDLPESLVRAGRAHAVPFILGAVTEEMQFLEPSLTQSILDSYNSDAELLIPSFFNLVKGSTASRQLANRIKSFFFGNRTISFDTISELINLRSDTMIYLVYRCTRLHATYGTAPVYSYLYTYSGSLKFAPGNYITNGPGHADELAYLFYVSIVPYNPNNDDMTVIKHMTNMWVDFAQYGDPSVHESVKWTPFSISNHTYLDIDVNLSLHQDMLKERMQFWDEMYDTYVNQTQY